MFSLTHLSPLLVSTLAITSVSSHHDGSLKHLIADPQVAINSVPFSTRAHWMRQANSVLTSPCPFSAFGTVIVNHTAPGLGQLVCTGVNSHTETGDPTLHGEIGAIRNCTAILTDPSGPYKLTPSQALTAFSQLSLYTNAESCSMCATAIRWAGLREYIYGSSVATLMQQGWAQIRIPSIEVFRQSFELGPTTRLMGEILTNETDPLFEWQFNPGFPCPKGCERVDGGSCGVVKV